MQVANVKTIRNLEAAYYKAHPENPLELMERAAEATANFIFELRNLHPALHDLPVLFFCGSGNNGGDGLGAAAILAEAGVETRVISQVTSDDLKNAPLEMYRRLNKNVKFMPFHSGLNLPDGLIVDAIFGIGFHGDISGVPQAMIDFINQSGFPVLSLDLPSGIDAETGNGVNAVQADFTATFILPKIGLYQSDGALKSGQIKVFDLGIDVGNIFCDTSFNTFCEADMRHLFRRKVADLHKNLNGRLLVVSGSKLYPGAALLNVNGALAIGCGMIRMAMAEVPYSEIPPSVIVINLSRHVNSQGTFGLSALPEILEAAQSSDVIVAGSGWSKSSDLKLILSALLKLPKTFVLDADALNLIAESPNILSGSPAEIILTPHPGEALHLTTALHLNPALPRQNIAQALAQQLNCTVILKGLKTIVASPDGQISISGNGSYALSKAGSGDLLAGICAALLASNPGQSSFVNASAAVFLHSFAADNAPAKSNLNINQLNSMVQDQLNRFSIF